MNCPNCGAENDAEARFCAECGTPLDNVVVETAKVEQVFNEADEEVTIISAPGEIAAEAKTMTVNQAEVVATVEDTDKSEEVDNDGSESASETSPAPPPSPADAGGNDQDGGSMDLDGGGDNGGGSGSNRTLIIVGIAVLLVLLLCCCCSVLVGVAVGSDPNMIEDLIREISMQPVYLFFV